MWSFIWSKLNPQKIRERCVQFDLLIWRRGGNHGKFTMTTMPATTDTFRSEKNLNKSFGSSKSKTEHYITIPYKKGIKGKGGLNRGYILHLYIHLKWILFVSYACILHFFFLFQHFIFIKTFSFGCNAAYCFFIVVTAKVFPYISIQRLYVMIPNLKCYVHILIWIL